MKSGELAEIQQKVGASLAALIRYVEKENYKGYDPYDSLRSPAIESLPSFAKFGIQQIQVRNPINIRRLLRVQKWYLPKGMALFLHSFSALSAYEERRKNILDAELHLRKADFFYRWLLKNATQGYNGMCWSMEFAIAKQNRINQAGIPSSVLACFAGNAMYEYYFASGRSEIIDSMKEIAQFLLTEIPITRNEHGICFSYRVNRRDIVFNANMLVAEFLIKLYSVTADATYINVAEECVRFTLAYQKEDGSWAYALDEKGGEKLQADFHQGFILDSLLEFCQIAQRLKSEVVRSLEKGLSFFENKIFRQSGVSNWRYPRRWPVDIHNQAQGIITFSKAARFCDDYAEFAFKIAEWTINNMQDSLGYFYYQKWPVLTNKIAYIRWGQAWMLYALACAKIMLERIETSGEHIK
jgi:hypothetical protein